MKNSKKILLVISIVLSMITLVGFVSNFVAEKPEMKRVLIRYVMAGETEPFDLYNEKHVVGDEIAVVSPQVLGGYTPRISVYRTTVKSDINVTVYYDFKASDVPIRENAVLYRADFENATTLTGAFPANEGLQVASTGGINGIPPIDYDFEKEMLHCRDYGYIELQDVGGIFNAASYTVSFSMYFEDFDEVGVSTALSFSYSRYDGSADTRYGKAMRLDSTGKAYLNDGTHVTSLHTGEWYNFLIYVDTEAQTNELFINGVSLGQSAMYDPALADAVKFRILDSDSRTSYYLDNFVIYEGTPVIK